MPRPRLDPVKIKAKNSVCIRATTKRYIIEHFGSLGNALEFLERNGVTETRPTDGLVQTPARSPIAEVDGCKTPG